MSQVVYETSRLISSFSYFWFVDAHGWARGFLTIIQIVQQYGRSGVVWVGTHTWKYLTPVFHLMVSLELLVTTSIILAIGLGIGAMYVRAMTIMLVEKNCTPTI